MGLIGNPSSVLLTTDEMNPKHLAEFRKGWVRYESLKLQRDGISKSVADRTASDEFDALERNGFTSVNDVTLKNRQARRAG